jgi:UDP-N-acetylglucosamine--dolichyl-phosphate N-acetylglucosaminephosphotransferase
VNPLFLALPILLSTLIPLLLTPRLAAWMRERGIVGTDLHKADRPSIPEMGGLAILLGLAPAFLFLFSLTGERDVLLLLGVILLVGGVGIVDDLRGLGPHQKVLLLSALGVLLLPFLQPSLAGLDLGPFFYLLVPLLFMAASNFTNMLAGFNGLEAGTGALAAAGLGTVALLRGEVAISTTAFSVSAALLAFLRYNWHPARIFPGDTGTLFIGAFLLSSLLLGGLEVPGALFFLPYLLDALLKYLSVGVMTRESQRPTVLREGNLYIPEGGNLSLPRLFLLKGPLGERAVVRRVWALEASCCLLAILLEVLG